MVTSTHSRQTPTVIDAAFEADSFDVLEVTVPAARVHLRPHAEKQRVEIHGFVPDCDPETARALFDRQGISTHQSSDRLYVFGNGPPADADGWRWRRRHRGEVHLDLRVPETLNVEAQTPGGAVHAAGLSGVVNLDVMGGSAEVEGMSGSVTVRGGGKRLGVHDFKGKTLHVQWASGSVDLENVSAESTTLRSVSAVTTVKSLRGETDVAVRGASLSLRNVAGPCSGTTYGGNLTYAGTPTDNTVLRAIGGSVETQFPPSLGATLLLSGERAQLDDAFAFDGERTPQRVEGTLNGGGPTLDLQAIRGDARCTAE